MNFNFDNIVNEWINLNHNNKYYLIITKCCGYEFLVPIYKKSTLRDLYYNVSLEHDFFHNFKLFISHEDISCNNYILNDVKINKFVKIASPLFASAVTYTMPIVAILWALIDGESLTLMQFFATAIILAGVYMVNRKSS